MEGAGMKEGAGMGWMEGAGMGWKARGMEYAGAILLVLTCEG